MGLGSIVRLETAEVSGLFVVVARGAFRPDTERDDVVPRYLVAPHPYGEAPDQETFPILADAIEEVVFEGYTNAADAAFLDDLLDQMQNGRRATKPARRFAGALTAIPETPDGVNNDATAEVARDPFIALRRLADQEDRRKRP